MSGRPVGASVLAVLLVLSCWISLGTQKGVAQTPPVEKRITLKFENEPVDKVLTHIFNHFGGRYTLHPDVKGNVTMDLRNVVMEWALANTLVQVNATWRVKGGVHEIVLRPEPVDPNPTTELVNERHVYYEDIRVALWRLFKKPFTMSPEVRGSVKVDPEWLTTRPFESNLDDLLKQANAGYRINGGIYEIVPLPPQNVDQRVLNFSAENEEIRDVLKRLFRIVDVAYTIAPELQGPVTLQFKNATFGSLLGSILKQVDGFYEIEGKTYLLKKRPSDAGEDNMETVRRGNKLINFSAQQTDIREALRTLFSIHGGSYDIKPDVQGTVTASYKNELFANVLSRVLQGVGAGWHVEKGVYQIYPTPARFRTGSDPTDYPRTILSPKDTPVTMTQDDKFIYILRGDDLYKVNKSDLKTVAKEKLGQ